MWNKVIVAYFTVLSQLSPGGSEENKNLSVNSQHPDRDSKAGTERCEAQVLTTTP